MNYMDFELILTTNFNISDVACLTAEWTAEKRGNRLERPRRTNGLWYLTDRPARFILPDGSRVVGEPGDVMLLPKGCRYDLQLLMPPEKKSHPLLINFRLTDAEGQEMVPAGTVRRLCEDGGELGALFAEALRIYPTATPVELKATIYNLFNRLAHCRSEDVLALDYIHRHPAHRLSVTALAKRCMMSETAYRKKFRAYTGLSPVRYINRLKIEKACRMMLGEEARLQEISDGLGFYSLPYFYKVFKEQTGCTPREYLRKMSEE